MMLFGSMQRSLAPARKERWEREKEKKDFHLEGAETLPDWSSLKKKMVAFFSSPFYVFLSFPFPMEGDFMMAVARGRTTTKKRGKACAHTERERKKKRHTKSSRQRKADARLLLSARGDAPKKWRSRHFGLGLDTTHFSPFSYPETHKIHLSFSFIIPSLRA